MPQIKVFNKYTKGYLGTYFTSQCGEALSGRVYYKRPKGTIGHVSPETADLRTA